MFFDQINAAIVSIRDFIKKKIKTLYRPQTFKQVCTRLRLKDWCNK